MWGYVLQHVLVMVPLALAVQGVEADCGEQGEEEAFSEGLGEVNMLQFEYQWEQGLRLS